MAGVSFVVLTFRQRGNFPHIVGQIRSTFELCSILLCVPACLFMYVYLLCARAFNNKRLTLTWHQRMFACQT